MLRRLAIFTLLPAVLGTTGVVLSAPAYAADHVICVNNPVGVTCDQSFAFLAAAVSAADGNGLDDTIVLGPGTYSDGPYSLTEAGFHEALVGSGQGATVLTMPAGPGQYYLNVADATVRDLTIQMNADTSQNDVALGATDSTISAVTVDGSNTFGAIGMVLHGSSLSGSTVEMTRALAAETIGVLQYVSGTVTDTAIAADIAYTHSDGGAATLSRVLVRGTWNGLLTTTGTINVDDTLIDLGTSAEGVGLGAYNSNTSNGSASVAADHVTIVGGGGNSVGVAAYAQGSGALQHSSVHLTNSIVSGPATSLDAQATNDGLQGANSTASITASYSDWATQNVSSGANGTATLINGAGRLNVNPGFRDAAAGDYRLAATSPLIDKGAPGTGGPTLDLSKGPRVLDGNADGVAVRDLGAYEAPRKLDTTAPNTTITSHPRKLTSRVRVTFRFTSNESHVTFQCRVDRLAWRACASPRSVRIARGWHVFRVRARDAAGNRDATPAIWRFKRI